MYNTVVFDLDGTLVNSIFDIGDSINKGLTTFGLKTHTYDEYYQLIGNGVLNLISDAIGKDACTDELVQNIKKIFDDDYKLHMLDKTKPYDGIYKMLKTLNEQGVNIAILSNKPNEFVGAIVEELFPDIKFFAVWGKKEEYQIKPHPDALFAMLKAVNTTAKDTLYVGDSDVDVTTATNAKVAFCGVNWGFRGKEELVENGATTTVNNAQELLNYILK